MEKLRKLVARILETVGYLLGDASTWCLLRAWDIDPWEDYDGQEEETG